MYNPVANNFVRSLLNNRDWNAKRDQDFIIRLNTVFQHLFAQYREIYGSHVNWEDELRHLVDVLYQKYTKRPAPLKKLDLSREQNPDWFSSEQIAGMTLYVDRFNKNLQGVEEKIDYFEDLGINLLHLMPLFEAPEKKSDGGYAVSNYRKVDPKFGTNKDLQSLSSNLHQKGMFLMIDLVINHSSDSHEWAKKAKKGEKQYQKYYYTFDERTIPELFERSLPEIFPENAPGNFTFIEEINKWVMTVFNHYQWDLNYSNPRVLTEMIDILLDLAAMGIDIFRLDAVAFLWKKMGTNSQNLPEAHTILKIMKAAAKIVAPGVIFLAEAIVAPQEILKYFGESETWSDECDIAYNATLMALMWDAICTKNARVLRNSIENLPHKPDGTTWINYLRCHDDIGLGYDNSDIELAGYTPDMHRKFIVDFLTGEFEGSFACGLPFMTNPETGDARISGSMASLAGLEKAIEARDEELIGLATDRILMMHGVIIAFGGIPMIYYGDELATLNDYSFINDQEKMDDNRWVHRPVIDWKKAEDRYKNNTPEFRVFNELKNMLMIRKRHRVLADRNNIHLPDVTNDHLFVFTRNGEENSTILVIANLSHEEQYLEAAAVFQSGLDISRIYDLLKKKVLEVYPRGLKIAPYGIHWITDRYEQNNSQAD